MAYAESTPRILVDPSDGGTENLSKIDKKGFAAGVTLALKTLRGERAEDKPAPTGA